MAPIEEKRPATWIRRHALFLCLTPAIVACLFSFLIPTICTIISSFINIRIIHGPGPLIFPNFSWPDNYIELFNSSKFRQSLENSGILVLVRILAFAFAPLLLAFVVRELGCRVKKLVRLLTTCLIAALAPASIAVVLVPLISEKVIPRDILNNLGFLAKGDLNLVLLSFLEWIVAASFALSAGLILFLVVLRRNGDHPTAKSGIYKPVFLCWLVGILTMIVFPLPSLLSYGYSVPGSILSETPTLESFISITGFFQGRYSLGAAASVLVLAVIVPIGLAIGSIVVFGKFRLVHVAVARETNSFTRRDRPAWCKILFGIASFVILLNAILISLIVLAPYGASISAAMSHASRNLDVILGGSNWNLALLFENTILPSLLDVCLLQIPIAYLAALGIGALRPLRENSERLLLLFAPWLLVTILPLSAGNFINIVFLRGYGHFNYLQSWIKLLPPISLNVPMLFILTIFFKGLAPKWRDAQSREGSTGKVFLREIVVPSLPLTAFLASIALFLTTQDFFWPSIIDIPSIPTYLLSLRSFSLHIISGTDAMANLILEIPILLLFIVVIGVFQIRYLDRLSLVAGEEKEQPDSGFAGKNP